MGETAGRVDLGKAAVTIDPEEFAARADRLRRSAGRVIDAARAAAPPNGDVGATGEYAAELGQLADAGRGLSRTVEAWASMSAAFADNLVRSAGQYRATDDVASRDIGDPSLFDQGAATAALSRGVATDGSGSL